jgi:hypothetical protein
MSVDVPGNGIESLYKRCCFGVSRRFRPLEASQSKELPCFARTHNVRLWDVRCH